MITPPKEYVQDPQAILDYRLDLLPWLQATEIVANASVTAETGLTVGVTTFTDTDVTVWISGGEIETRYRVTFHWETSQGREDDRSIIIYVKER